jgi:hypothetical protein
MVWRVDNSSAVTPEPTIPAAGTQGFFSNGNELTGTPATVVDAWWLNMIQEEIRNVVVAAGIAPNKADNTQLLAAIGAVTGGNIYLPLAGGTMTGQIHWSGVGNGPPDTNGTGQRLVIWDAPSGSIDYAIGIASAEFWFSCSTNAHFSFYEGTNLNARVPPSGNPTQPYDLVTLGYLGANSRTFLTAHKYVYISPTGSDTTGDGTNANPWATLQYAWDTIQAFTDYAGFQVTCQMADGTYHGSLEAAGVSIGATQTGAFIVRGNVSNNAAVVLNVTGDNALTAYASASFTVQHLTVMSTTSGGEGGAGIAATYGGVVIIGPGVVFGACSGNHMYATAGGSIIATAGYTISAGAQAHAEASTGGYIELSEEGGPTYAITLTGTPNFSNAFAIAYMGNLASSNNTFSGAATGPKYLAELNGVIFTGGKSVNYFPGSVAGTTSTGGQYD